MKKLKIYRENGEFVIERSNEENEVRKRYFLDEEDLKEALIAYNYVIDNYQIEINEDVENVVRKYLKKPKSFTV